MMHLSVAVACIDDSIRLTLILSFLLVSVPPPTMKALVPLIATTTVLFFSSAKTCPRIPCSFHPNESVCRSGLESVSSRSQERNDDRIKAYPVPSTTDIIPTRLIRSRISVTSHLSNRRQRLYIIRIRDLDLMFLPFQRISQFDIPHFIPRR